MFKRTMRSSAVSSIVWCCALTSMLHAEDKPKAFEETPKGVADVVESSYRPLLAQYDVPGIAVAVTVNGHEYYFSYGLASRETNIPVTKDTIFEIGSLSKTFTATLATYAQALGKLSLDDHPSKYMPQLNGDPIDQASLLNLGTFTAGGLPLQVPDAVTDDAQMIQYFQQWKPAAAIGTTRQYSNPSIGLFGYVTALAMQANFADLAETELFPKLKLHHTYIRVPETALPGYAWGYDKINKPIHVNPGVFDVEAYGVKSTAADMIHFVEANINQENFEPAMRSAIEGTHIGYFTSGEMMQGLGWEQYSYPLTVDRLLAGNSDKMILEANPAEKLTPPRSPITPTFFNKTGSTNGFAAYAAFVPAERIGIVMLANKNFPIPARIRAAFAVIEQLAALSGKDK